MAYVCVHVPICMFFISRTSLPISKFNQKAKLVFGSDEQDYVAHTWHLQVVI